MKRLLGLVLAILAFGGLKTGYAQLVVDNTMTPQQLVQDVLLGQGVVVSNITYTGAAVQSGYFDGSNSNVGISEGVILSSGDVADAIGPNNSGSSGTGVGNNSDADLETLSGVQSFDAVVLEFDFVPTGDSIKFNYVFGSEEYNEYVCAGVNDVFGFFLSGPGFNGPFTNNAVNIALIPGTSTPVSINTVNNGTSGINGTAANCAALDPNWASYNIYYTDNAGGASVQYDGLTVPLRAEAQVQCGETYHIKMALSDGGDGVFDSGVFIEARSFQSNAINVNIQTASGSVEDGGGWIVEGCTPADITFERPIADVDSFLSVPVYVSGSAINGVDYTGVPDTVHFVPGDTSLTFTIEAIDDLLTEPNDSIVITVYSLNLCGDTTVSTGTIHIYDIGFYNYVAGASAPSNVQCAGDSVLVTATASMGNPEYTFSWSNGLVGDSIWIHPTGDTLIYVNTTDACGTQANQDSVFIEYLVNPDPMVHITGPATFNCVPQPATLNASGSLGNSPYVYLWSTGAGGSSINVSLISDTLFYVTAFDQCGVASEPDTLVITQNPVAIPNLQTSADVVLDCPGETATLTAIASGGVQPYTYTWSSNQSTSTITVQPTQTTDYIITITDDCYVGEVKDTITVTVEPYTEPTVSISDTTVQCPGDLVVYLANVQGGNDPFQYSWSTGSTDDNTSLNPTETVDVTVTVVDDCQMSTSSTATVTVPVFDTLKVSILNADLLNGDTVVVCELWSDTLASSVSGGLAPYAYSWNGTLIEGAWITNDSAKVTVPFELPPDSSVVGLYSLTVTDECMDQATAEVVVAAISCDVVAPNVINPNSQFMGGTDICGHTPQNNVFNLPCLELYPGNTLTIWDRWGRKVYKTDDYQLHPWDGGNHSTGTFYYVCELPNGKDPVKGYFQVVR
ncbi:MAG: hypothetical protein GC178_16065 [Flavobacteriales bacterium]|nr:hypothetical protein [Flavobacteriales bacterium]